MEKIALVGSALILIILSVVLLGSSTNSLTTGREIYPARMHTSHVVSLLTKGL